MTGTGYRLGDFTADRADEHVVIQAQVGPEGKFTQNDGTPLPQLRPGSSVQLRVRAASLIDKEQLAALSLLEMRELLPQEQVLFALVDTRSLDDPALVARLRREGTLDALGYAREETRRHHGRSAGRMDAWSSADEGPKAHEGLIEVRLLEPLVMERKGLKTYRLRPCPCIVPALKYPPDGPDHDFSLNHALTRMSEHLELHRISHTGNAFTRYLVPDSTGGALRLRRLGSLRDERMG